MNGKNQTCFFYAHFADHVYAYMQCWCNKLFFFFPLFFHMNQYYLSEKLICREHAQIFYTKRQWMGKEDNGRVYKSPLFCSKFYPSRGFKLKAVSTFDPFIYIQNWSWRPMSSCPLPCVWVLLRMSHAQFSPLIHTHMHAHCIHIVIQNVTYITCIFSLYHLFMIGTSTT